MRFADKENAIVCAESLFRANGVKLFIYYCPRWPCCMSSMLHLTKKEPGGPKLKNLNEDLFNYYSENSQFFNGVVFSRRLSSKVLKKIARRALPYEIWEGEGGALREYED